MGIDKREKRESCVYSESHRCATGAEERISDDEVCGRAERIRQLLPVSKYRADMHSGSHPFPFGPQLLRLHVRNSHSSSHDALNDAGSQCGMFAEAYIDVFD